MLNKKITIAVDGYSSCGKSTLSKALAKKLGYIFIDSGAMYRGVALYCIENRLIKDNAPLDQQIIASLSHISLNFQKNDELPDQNDLFLNGINVEKKIRTPEIAAQVSKIARIKEVRLKLVEEQRKMGERGGIVMDGRDIGSVVFPDAELKLFVTAQPEIRAKRRLLELQQKGIDTSFAEVLQNLNERDFLDSSREESPLVQLKDAIVLDTSNLTPEEQLQIAYDYVLNILRLYEHQQDS
jgi:cytidylate kinase